MSSSRNALVEEEHHLLWGLLYRQRVRAVLSSELRWYWFSSSWVGFLSPQLNQGALVGHQGDAQEASTSVIGALLS
jgi:hypothetical protein